MQIAAIIAKFTRYTPSIPEYVAGKYLGPVNYGNHNCIDAGRIFNGFTPIEFCISVTRGYGCGSLVDFFTSKLNQNMLQ